MTWDNTNLYVGIAQANRTEAAIIYLDKNPLAPINGGINSDGTIVGQLYDNTNFAALQFRADLVMYVKHNYQEYRTANGSNGWSSPTTGFGSYADNGSNTREFSIPWSAIGGRPNSFAWFGYLTSSDGYVYGQVPTENSGGNIGTSARYVRYYIVNDTGDGTSTKPFSRNSYVFNSTSDITGFGAISVYDFTMNIAGRTITRAAGAWTITGSLRVDAGTVSFGSTSDTATVSGNVVIGSDGTLTLSTAIGGDLNVGGNWTRTGTFNPNNRLVKFNGSGTQTVTGATTFDYLDIANTSGGNMTLASDITVKRELKLSSGGTLNAGSTTITVEGSSSVETPFINNGTFNAGTGTVVFKGANNKNSRVVGSSATTFNNVTIQCTGTCGTAEPNVFGVDFYDHQNATRATINGTLHLSTMGTFVATREPGGNGGACTSGNCDGRPFYASGSTLRYSTGHTSGTPFGSAAEWWPNNNCADIPNNPGMPHHVVIDGNTHVNIGAAFTNNSLNPQYSANSDKTACGDITIASGSGLQSTAGTLTVKGNWTNNGTFNAGTGTVTFNGSGTQTIGGTSGTTFNNLTINNSSPDSAGVTLGSGQTVNGTLTLTDGLVKIGSYNLTLGPNATVSGGSVGSMVVTDTDGSAAGDGFLCKQYAAGAFDPTAFTFPVGDYYNTTQYTPAVLDFDHSTFGSSAQVCVRVTNAKHPSKPSDTEYPTWINRYWTVTQNNISAFTCATTFSYREDGTGDDVVIGTGQSEAALYHKIWDGSSWTTGNQANTSANTFGSTVSSFSDHTAFSGSPLAVSLAAFTADAAPTGVTLTWETVSEADNAGFNVYRAPGNDDFSRPAGPWTKLNGALIPAAAPGSGQGHTYTWTDTTATPGVYWYMLEVIALDGTATQHPPVQVTMGEPNAVGLAGPLVVAASAGEPALAGLAALVLAALAGAARTRKRS